MSEVRNLRKSLAQIVGWAKERNGNAAMLAAMQVDLDKAIDLLSGCCPKCWRKMTYNERRQNPWLCPECGHTEPDHGDLL